MRLKLLSASYIIIAIMLPGSVVMAQTSASDASSRLVIARQKQNLTLDEATKAKIVSTCKGAQDSLQIVKQRNEKQSKLRLETYQDVSNKALALNIRIKRQGVNTAVTGQTLVQLKSQVTQFEELEKSYQQVLGDTIAIDCQQNPELFKAGLEFSRQTQTQLLNKTEEIKNFVTKDVDNSFNDLRVKLSS